MARCEVRDQRTVQRIGRADENRRLRRSPSRKFPQPHRRKLQHHRVWRGPGQRLLVRRAGRRGFLIGEPLRVGVQRQSRGFQRPQPDLLRPVGARIRLRQLCFFRHARSPIDRPTWRGRQGPSFDSDQEPTRSRSCFYAKSGAGPSPINGHALATRVARHGRAVPLRRPRRVPLGLDPPRQYPAEIGQRRIRTDGEQLIVRIGVEHFLLRLEILDLRGNRSARANLR